MQSNDYSMISVNNLTVRFEQPDKKPKTVLRDIDLTIGEGESIAIMGPNGSGKTTFARCLNALLQPSEGTVLVNGLSTSAEENWPAIRRLVGMVFQNPDNQIVSATIEREIAFGLENLGIPHEQMLKKVEAALQQFDLEHLRHKTPHYLSGGEKQRLAIAAVMAMEPAYLILDEPTSLLDPRGRKNILNVVRNLHDNPGPNSMTTILVTQFAEETMIADRLIVFNKGKILFDDTPAKVFRNVEQLIEIGLEPPIHFLLDKIASKWTIS